MIFNWLLANWLSWSVQILILSCVGCLAPRVLRLTDPKSRLLGAQFTLLVCLFLPFASPRFPSSGSVTIGNLDDALGPIPGRRIPKKRPSQWLYVVPGLLAAGALIRFSGLTVGLWKLRSYRRSARTVDPLPEAVSEAFALTRTCCEVGVTDRAHSPATFGLLNPIVLLPLKFQTLPQEAQLAVACHELLHVRRRDWLAAVAEEIVACLFWFQPAVYLLVADIRLAREQLVDRGVVELTQARQPYVEAMLAVAGEPFGAAISMAPLFLHRKNLKSRVSFLLEELHMSKTKVVFANVSLAALLCAAGWVSSISFPLVAVAQEQEKEAPKDGKAQAQNFDFAKAFPPATGMRIRIGGNVLAANLLSQVKPPYPADARAARIQGTVKLGVLVGTDGHISDIVLISGAATFVQSSIDAVRQWVYRPTLLNGEPVEVISIVDVNYTLTQ
jgi:TonB family protein